MSRYRSAPEASTDDLVRDLDERQHTQGTGPCLDAAARGDLVSVPDLAAEDRWPFDDDTIIVIEQAPGRVGRFARLCRARNPFSAVPPPCVPGVFG